MLSGLGKKTFWKTFIRYPHVLTEVERADNVDDVEKCVCLLYGIEKNVVKDIDDTRHSGFEKTKLDLEILPQKYERWQRSGINTQDTTW